MADQSEYRAGALDDVIERLDKIEAAVRRVLNLQRFDDLTGGSSLIPSNLCTHSGISEGCSTKSVGCRITAPTPSPANPTPAG